MRTAAATLLLVLAGAMLVEGQDARKFGGKEITKEEQRQIDEAIRKGVAFLKTQAKDLSGYAFKGMLPDELVLWTFVHAGVPETDPDFRLLFDKMMAAPLKHTYGVSLQAMILEQVHRVKYQMRILQCAQFLVDNQCRNGQWSYGENTVEVKDVPTTAGTRKIVATGTGKAGSKTKVVQRIPVVKKRDGPAEGDNSNSQYAALGLRACHDAGILLPEAVLALGEKYWRESQGGQGGWGYQTGHAPYGSMTAGAAGSLVIYNYLQHRPWMQDKNTADGIKWMVDRFTVTENIERAEQRTWMLYYYLYALERLGILYGTESFGAHAWYPLGARFLLQEQKPEGFWMEEKSGYGSKVWDSCFAILFLRRATRPLTDVESVDRVLRK